jgi:hypothetical protein
VIVNARQVLAYLLLKRLIPRRVLTDIDAELIDGCGSTLAVCWATT